MTIRQIQFTEIESFREHRYGTLKKNGLYLCTVDHDPRFILAYNDAMEKPWIFRPITDENHNGDHWYWGNANFETLEEAQNHCLENLIGKFGETNREKLVRINEQMEYMLSQLKAENANLDNLIKELAN